MKAIIIFAMSIVLQIALHGQTIKRFNASTTDTPQKFLFYLHGAIVQEQGINAFSEDFGRYEYVAILDTLKKYGYEVISEARPKGTEIIEYAKKVSNQIDSLMRRGVSPKNIIIVGASQGAYITVEVAYMQKNDKIQYAIMGLCNEYNLKFFAKYKEALCGNWLSIYESSDQKRSCQQLLGSVRCKTGFKEVELHLGNGHGFIYKPHKEWVHPLITWIEGKETK